MDRLVIEAAVASGVAVRGLVALRRAADPRTQRTLARGRQIVLLRLLRTPTPDIVTLVGAMNEDDDERLAVPARATSR
jgi:hypothetical protein